VSQGKQGATLPRAWQRRMGDSMGADIKLAEQQVISEFAEKLAALRAGNGDPSFEQMERTARRNGSKAGSSTTFHRMLKPSGRLPDASIVCGFVLGLGLSVDDVAEWEDAHQQAVSKIKEIRSPVRNLDSDASIVQPTASIAAPFKAAAISGVDVKSRKGWPVLTLAVAGSAIVFFALGFSVDRWTVPSRPNPTVYASGQLRGKPDLQAACNTQLGSGRKAVITDAGSSSSWECLRPGMLSGTGKNGIDIGTQCATQFPGSEAKALRPEDPTSWACVQR